MGGGRIGGWWWCGGWIGGCGCGVHCQQQQQVWMVWWMAPWLLLCWWCGTRHSTHLPSTQPHHVHAMVVVVVWMWCLVIDDQPHLGHAQQSSHSWWHCVVVVLFELHQHHTTQGVVGFVCGVGEQAHGACVLCGWCVCCVAQVCFVVCVVWPINGNNATHQVVHWFVVLLCG